MLYKKNVLGIKYTRLLTASPTFFIIFVLLGVVLFLFLTITTKVPTIKIYPAKVLSIRKEPVLLIENGHIPIGESYLYSNRNEVVFSVSIERIENISEGVALYFSSDSKNTITSLSNENLFIEIPQGKESLLYRIFVKGGKGYE
ncbi:hypothetical protein [Oceanirhabdus sp. W0125-5]|uniref:hypothetical protein n=1 Tax=Oceanirhabdus sp. W0125-5 TaxID=2999116 RepID=UPI0022F2F617|nr:hypothetical protein [Oceanirhabdus sp. W0125-5]WBW97919.1 hypothetical protein OW730_03840 [Oceanirhabdus sp. W0125-5]